MSTVGYIPPELTEAELRALVQDALENAPGWGNIETFHARFHHLDRGITLDDVIHGLERPWVLERKPEFNKDEWQWKYRIATETVDGDPIVILIAVDTTNRTFDVVTRWK
jgi:Domain of unknown function (DUF4258)